MNLEFEFKREELQAHFLKRRDQHRDKSEDIQSRVMALKDRGPEAMAEAMTLLDGWQGGASLGPSSYGGVHQLVAGQMNTLLAELGRMAGQHRRSADAFEVYANHLPFEPSFKLSLNELSVYEFTQLGPVVGLGSYERF